MSEARFAIGDAVVWTSQAGGYSRAKRGVVHCHRAARSAAPAVRAARVDYRVDRPAYIVAPKRILHRPANPRRTIDQSGILAASVAASAPGMTNRLGRDGPRPQREHGPFTPCCRRARASSLSPGGAGNWPGVGTSAAESTALAPRIRQSAQTPPATRRRGQLR
jgi:hypothetical protein